MGKSFLHRIVIDHEKLIHCENLKERKCHTLTASLIYRKNACCVIGWIYSCTLRVAQIDRIHYWDSLLNIVDKIESSILKKRTDGYSKQTILKKNPVESPSLSFVFTKQFPLRYSPVPTNST